SGRAYVNPKSAENASDDLLLEGIVLVIVFCPCARVGKDEKQHAENAGENRTSRIPPHRIAAHACPLLRRKSAARSAAHNGELAGKAPPWSRSFTWAMIFAPIRAILRHGSRS